MPVQDLLIITLSVTVMLSVGLSLRSGDLSATTRHPGGVLFALLANLIVLPAIALFFAHSGQLPVAAAVALLLCAACGVGNSAPLMTANARGDVGVTITVMMVLMAASLVTLPATLAFYGAGMVSVHYGAVVEESLRTMLYYQIIPLLIGVLLHMMGGKKAEEFGKFLRAMGNAFLALIIIGSFAFNISSLFVNGGFALVAQLFLVIISITMGPLLTFKHRRLARALAMTVSGRNLALALLIASQVFVNDAMVAAVMSYGLFMYLAMAAATVVTRLRSAARQRARAADGTGSSAWKTAL